MTTDYDNCDKLALGGQTEKNLRLLASKFELDQSQCKSTQVVASRCKWMAKRSVSPKLASTCESVRPGLNIAVAWTGVLHCAMGLPAIRKTATKERILRILIGWSSRALRVTLRNDEKGDKIVSVIVAKSKIKFYFLQRLWQQQNCKTSCMKNCLV